MRHVLGILGCSSMLGMAAFVLFFAIALLNPPSQASDLTEYFWTALMVGAIGGGIATVASIALFARDSGEFAISRGQTRQHLLARNDVSDDRFCDDMTGHDPNLVLQIRQAIGEFFDVPSTKVWATDRLQSDYGVQSLEPAFHSHVVLRVLEQRRIEVNSFSFNSKALDRMTDLTQEVERILNNFPGS